MHGRGHEVGVGAFGRKARGYAVAVPRAALNGKPGRLGDDEQILILIHDGQ